MTIRVKKINHLKRKALKKLSKRAALTLSRIGRVHNRWDMGLTARPAQVNAFAKFWFRQAKVLAYKVGMAKKQVRGLALLMRLNLRHYVMQARIKILKLVKSAKSFRVVGAVKGLAGFVIRATAISLVALMVLVPALSAFEAHIINVTAEAAQIDPPVLTPPGGSVPWDNPMGGTNLSGTVNVVMSDDDSDATHIYYTYGSGTDPSAIPNPVCGQTGPNGGGGPKGAPQQISFNSDTVVKAIACDGADSSAHKSVINTKIYTFRQPCEDRLIPLDVMLVIDRSGSMAGYKLNNAKAAAQSFMGNLSAARDQVGLVSFSSSATLDEQLTNNFAGVSSTIASLTADGATNIADALDKANTELSSPRAQSDSTKVIILLTDGRANRPGSGDDNPTAIAAAQAEADEAASKGFLLYTIGLGADINGPFLIDLAERTGGKFFASPTPEQLTGIYNEIAKLLCGYGTISGYKFHDLNQDGVWATSTEPAISGWKITLKRGMGTFGMVLTGQDGYYEFTDLPANVEFTVIEEARAGWAQTVPLNGQYTITLTTEGEHSENNNFGNFDTGQQCVPVPVTFPVNLAVLAAGNTSGYDDITMDSNVVINGDARSNDDINAPGGSKNRTINGNATAGDSIDTSHINVTGTVTQHAPTTSLPLSTSTIQAFKDHAKEGGTVNGSLEFPNNTTGLELGPSEIMGNLKFGSGNSATIKGPLYIHGNLFIGSNTVITEYSSFGDLLVPIIVDGRIDVSSNITFNGSGVLGGFLLISTHSAVSGDDAAIETSSNNSDLGDVVLYASEGDVHIRSNRTLLAIYAKHGTASDNPAIRLDSNVTVNWRPFGTQIGCGPRFTPINQLLINEFMPNPSGSDNAAMPNGEWVELYNGGAAPVDVNGYVLYDDYIPTGTVNKSKQWDMASDFASGIMTNTYVETSGDDRVRIVSGQLSGTFEMVFDAGLGKTADWQSISWHEDTDSGSNICLQAATSNDGVSYSAYSSSDCGSPMSLTGLSDSRFLKWKSTHTRTGTTKDADLLDLTLSYKLPNTDYHELVISSSNTDTGSTVINPGELLVVYRNGDSDFELDNDGIDTVKLYNGDINSGATLIDSYTYNYGGSVPDNKSFSRIPDGSANWVDPDPTPGEPNMEFINPDITPSEPIVFEDEPATTSTEEILPPQPGESDYIEPEVEQSELTQEAPVTQDAAGDVPTEESLGIEQAEQTEQQESSQDEQVTEQATEQPAEAPSPTDIETVEGTEPKEEESLPPQDETAPEVIQEPPASDDPPAQDEPDPAETVQQQEDPTPNLSE